jgi:hypothetical protein
MNWKKRKRLRRIAQHYGYTHYWEYKRNLKFCIHYTAFEYALKNCLIHWSEVLPRMNQMFCKAGLPEYCMTQEEWYAKVMKNVDELEQQDGMIVQFTNDESASQSMKVDKPVNIVVEHNFHKQLESAVSEMCDRTRKERLGYVDYTGITKHKPEWKGLCLTLEDLDNGQTSKEET